jgi:hypothetical protein
MSSPTEKPSVLERLRADTRLSLARHRGRRRALARTVRHALREHRAAAIASMQAVLRPLARRASVWELWPPGAADRRGSGGSELQAEVLSVIDSHPEGIRALDIGNELGIDWHAIVPAVRNLVDAGLAERVDQEFYPAGKGSGRW